MGTVQKNCEACAGPINVRLADHKRGWGRFCDKACAAAFKVGQRPRDVNAYHAKFSGWAAERHAAKEAAGGHGWGHGAAPSIKEQVGKRVKVRPIYHSPCQCRRCGEPINGPGVCDYCVDDFDPSWDAHKAETSQ